MTSLTKQALAGLAIGIAGIIIQFIAAPEIFGTVPPGAFILAAFGLFVALGTRWWWSPLVGVAIAAWVSFGGLLAGELVRNLRSGDALLVAGNIVMVIGLIGAVITGSLAAAENRGRRHSPIPTAQRAALACGAGLLLAAGGDAAQGYDGPGPFIFLGIGIVVLAFRRTWATVLGLLTGAFFLFGAFTNPGTMDRFGAPSDVTPFVGTVYQILGFVIAVVAGVIALLPMARSRSEIRTRG
jgi:hypothetical protein